MNNNTLQRKTDTIQNQAGDYYSGPDKYYDQVSEKTIVKIFSGDHYVSPKENEVLVTILGSCISCCLYDPKLKFGGMNHFLVPGNDSMSDNSARYGINAMELLINNMIKYGSNKGDLIAKIFGGASLIGSSAQVGKKNIEFVKDFLGNEEIRIDAEDVGGDTPRRLHYHSGEGKVLIRKLQRAEDLKIAEKEKQYIDTINKISQNEDITLFD